MREKLPQNRTRWERCLEDVDSGWVFEDRNSKEVEVGNPWQIH